MKGAGFKDVAYEEAMTIAAELYDFSKTCVYPGGDSYGIPDNKKCRAAPEGAKAEKEETIKSALKELKSYKPGYQKTGGDNLQDPKQASKYEDFYKKDKDLSYKAPKNTDPAVVKEVLQRLKEEDPAQYKDVVRALNSKGSPPKEMKEEAGWKGSERSEAVLKSLMDNDFKDVLGEKLPWGQGLQLDHRMAGSVGGKDTPDNWIWISTATNQTKGGYEAAAKKIKGTAEEKEAYIKKGLISSLNANSKMTSAQVAEVKAKGAATVAAKAEGAAKTRKMLPTMSPADRSELISKATGPKLKEMLKASVAEGKNPVTGRPTSYRPVLSGGNGARVRKDYGTTPQMKALLKARWGEPLTDADKKALGQMLNASTGSTKSSAGKLDEMFGNFPPAKPISSSDRADILSNAS